MTKKEAKARKAAYQLALSEGRVVRYNSGLSYRAFPTVEAAETFLANLLDDGHIAIILNSGAVYDFEGNTE